MKSTKQLSGIGVSKNDSVLFLFPHPDDETFTSAGLLQKLVRNNIRTRVAIFTEGEKSTLKYKLPTISNLASVRRGEFQNAMKVLNVSNHHQYDLPDGALENHMSDLEKIVRCEINRFQPKFVVTLEPSGLYGHPDHIALTKVVREQVEPVSAPERLIYATLKPGFKQKHENLRMAKDPASVNPIYPHVQLGLTITERFGKYRAFKEHASQFKLGIQQVTDLYFRGVLRAEYFHLA